LSRLEVPDTPAIVALNLSRRFGSRWALRGFSIHVAPQSVLLVAGPNGSGKTTLLKLLATALRPSRGTATIFGYDLLREAGAVRSLATMVSEPPGLYGRLSARENLLFAAAMSGATASVDTLLDEAGLASARDHYVRTFSQGMKRRLALTRARLLSPKLLLLDEPFSGLDKDGLLLAETVIGEVKAAGGAVVLATHEWERGVRVADRVAQIFEGRLVRVEDRQRTVAGMKVVAGALE
jgi:ABC-type multidrug transport system ATPase subunit